MSTAASRASSGTREDRSGSVADAWSRRAHQLAAWVDRNMVNRCDCFGHYIAAELRSDPDLIAFTDKAKLTPAVIERHFRARNAGDLIGLHSTVRDEPRGEGETAACWSKWLAVDIDRHGDDGDPDSNLKVARSWYARASRFGFVPLLLDSNGRGGFHLIILFDPPAPTEKVHALGRWLTRDWNELSLSEAPELFPKQPTINAGGYGNWLRLPGRHHTRNHFTRVWDGSKWLEGTAAVEAILATVGSSADRIPSEALRPKERPKGERKEPRGFDPDSDPALAREALQFLQHMADPYLEWLKVGMCLTPLGSEGLRLCDEWSRHSSKYDEGTCERKWRSFRRNGADGLTLGTLFHEAKRFGFSFPSGARTDGSSRSPGPRPSTNGKGNGNHPGPDHDKAKAPTPNEADDDPHRLARIYLKRVEHPEGLTLRFWREEWHRWDGSAYRVVSDKEVRGELTGTIKAEFDMINLAELEAHDGKKAPPRVRPVTTKLVGNVLNALSDLALLRARDCPQAPGWLCEEPPWPASEMLPTRNALVHLPSLVECRERFTVLPTPAFFCPYSLDFDFDRNAPKPNEWLAFLAQLWPDDPQSVSLLQEWFGYLLTSDTSQQKMLMLIGPKRSGKGTIARVLRALIGPENVASPTLSKMATGFGLAPLIGKTAAIIADARLSGRADQAVIVERLLSVTGEDSQSIDRKHRDDWEGKLATRFLLISNVLPRLTDASAALPSRMLILRLTRSFYGHQDLGLLPRLLHELPGILLWAIAGWQRLRSRGRFEQPESARELAEEMEALASPINVFLRDCCKKSDAAEVETGKLFSTWKGWCETNGRESPGNQQNFGRNLRAAIPRLATISTRDKNGKPVRKYVGVRLREAADDIEEGTVPY